MSPKNITNNIGRLMTRTPVKIVVNIINCCNSVLGSLIDLLYEYLALYTCFIVVILSSLFSFKVRSMLSGLTMLLVISTRMECSFTFNLSTYGWPTNVSYKSWLWVPHITLNTQPSPFLIGLPRNLKGHWHFQVPVTVTSKPSLYFL